MKQYRITERSDSKPYYWYESSQIYVHEEPAMQRYLNTITTYTKYGRVYRLEEREVSDWKVIQS